MRRVRVENLAKVPRIVVLPVEVHLGAGLVPPTTPAAVDVLVFEPVGGAIVLPLVLVVVLRGELHAAQALETVDCKKKC